MAVAVWRCYHKSFERVHSVEAFWQRERLYITSVYTTRAFLVVICHIVLLCIYCTARASREREDIKENLLMDYY